MTRDRFRQFAWGLIAYNLIVIVWGVYVRASFSGDGCGTHWPLCAGQILPVDAQVKTYVEFAHRVTSGLAIFTVLLLLYWACKAYPKGHQVRKAAALSVAFTFSEALLGAALVLFKWVTYNKSVVRAVAMGSHLTNTLILLAMLCATAWCASGGKLPTFRRQGPTGIALIVAAVGVLVMGVTGTIAALGDTLFPSTSIIAGMKQDFAPTAHYLLKLRPIHPVIAVVVALYVGGIASMVGKARPYPQVIFFKKCLMWTFAAQMAMGFLNLMLHAPVWLQLFHLLIADIIWLNLVLLICVALAPEYSMNRSESGVLSDGVSR